MRSFRFGENAIPIKGVINVDLNERKNSGRANENSYCSSKKVVSKSNLSVPGMGIDIGVKVPRRSTWRKLLAERQGHPSRGGV